ncbi:alkene reductase [Segniliparus rugosus]|uniref:NADH:flavin oxidoreductase/NADH oxidase N-terminal domain-containing protein n=1 Tax=Segniliparus rugosus (strain ATCC BAA-974 / DSM 45345 / CCUG 50838 / CIP 108380 / JCM 13579 / CDC 945) TaxID=679197 RepID=E5XU29_SEGRC|nr:alkene reductase [Segniliparus rugosus]EFV12145.1 hypothetical protein HMPREF9336_03001 [Segniliparus rugosus ATCC BAA-974]
MPTIFDPVKLGKAELRNRIAMAPMTRSRANADGSPAEITAEYYAQRAGIGLLIAEGTQPSDEGQGYSNTPGIYTPQHIAAWRKVSDAVHAAGGHIFVQLMHVGRIGHPANTQRGTAPVAPSAVPLRELKMFTADGMREIPLARELSLRDIDETKEAFATAARSAVAAGLDGVELHGANGYLLHQFLSPNTNLRSDEYGGNRDNRQRFVVEVARRVAEEIGADRTGIRLSPGGTQGEIEEGPGYVDEYVALAEKLSQIGLAYLHIAFLRPVVEEDEELLRRVREVFRGIVIVNRAGRPVEAIGQDIARGVADIEAIGVLALANPDLPRRLRDSLPLNEPRSEFFYGGGSTGYTDYAEYSA